MVKRRSLSISLALLILFCALTVSIAATDAQTFLADGVTSRISYGVGGEPVAGIDVSRLGEGAAIPRAPTATAVNSTSNDLPFTGSSPLRVTVVAFGLTTVGAVIVRSARRRRRA